MKGRFRCGASMSFAFFAARYSTACQATLCGVSRIPGSLITFTLQAISRPGQARGRVLIQPPPGRSSSSPSPPSEGERAGERRPILLNVPHPGPTGIELSELRQDRSAHFSPLPALLSGPEGSGVKSALLNSMAVHPGPLPTRSLRVEGENFWWEYRDAPRARLRGTTLAQNPFLHVKVHRILEHFALSLGARTARLFGLRGFRFFGGALQVQGEKLFENLFLAQIGGPAVGGGHGGVEFLVGQVQPRGAFVVKVREGALFQLRGAVGVARFKARIPDEPDLVGRVPRRGGWASAR